MSIKLCDYYSKYNQNAIVGISHEQIAIAPIQEMIYQFHPELIIELGTYEGGMSLVLHEACLTAEFHSYDVDFVTQYQVSRNQEPPVRKAKDEWFNEKCFFYLEDVLVPNEKLITLCKDVRKKILYCDNGNKPLETQIYAPLLNSGDMLGVHDWGIEIKQSDVNCLIDTFKELSIIGTKYKSKFWTKI